MNRDNEINRDNNRNRDNETYKDLHGSGALKGHKTAHPSETLVHMMYRWELPGLEVWSTPDSSQVWLSIHLPLRFD